MGQICKYCGEEFFFNNKVSMGGHVASCELNPNSKFTREKQSKTKTKPLLFLKLNCLKCDVEFEQYVKEYIFRNNKHKKYCSFFQKLRRFCTARLYGECDCPKCQGLCNCQ